MTNTNQTHMSEIDPVNSPEHETMSVICALIRRMGTGILQRAAEEQTECTADDPATVFAQLNTDVCKFAGIFDASLHSTAIEDEIPSGIVLLSVLQLAVIHMSEYVQTLGIDTNAPVPAAVRGVVMRGGKHEH